MTPFVVALLALVAVSSANVLKDCQSKPDSGFCDAYFRKHFFNASSGQCEEFVYGGCGGNNNKYNTHEECHDSCHNQVPVEAVQCGEEPSGGLCRAAFPKYFFNKHTGQCHEFIYGGCGGNTNSFDSEEECLQQCQHTTVEPVDCGAEREVGRCKAYIPSYHYNAKTGQCEEFIYGGCGGNTNRFFTHDSCHATCSGYQKVQNYKVAEEFTYKTCLMEPVTGNCMGYMQRFFFNRKIGQCEQFIYGGCAGNGNNFLTEKDCTDHCLTY